MGGKKTLFGKEIRNHITKIKHVKSKQWGF